MEEGWSGAYDTPVIWKHSDDDSAYKKEKQLSEERHAKTFIEESGEIYKFVVCGYDHYIKPPGYKDLVNEYSQLGVEITLYSHTQMMVYEGPKEYAIPFVCECYNTADRVEAESIIMDLNGVESLDELLV